MNFTIDLKRFPGAAGKEAQILSTLRAYYRQPSERARKGIERQLDKLAGKQIAWPEVIPSPESRLEIRITPVEGGVRVGYGSCLGRTYPRIHDLRIENGLPLYVASLPDDRANFYSTAVVVYGTEEFGGPEWIDRIHGVLDGQPVYSGSSWDDGRFCRMTIGTRVSVQHDDIDIGSVQFVCDRVLYVARNEGLWSAYIDGEPQGNRFEERPEIEHHEWTHPIMASLFATGAVNSFIIRGRRNGRFEHDTIRFESDIAQRLADVNLTPASEPVDNTPSA